jgi:hypothetical protein
MTYTPIPIGSLGWGAPVNSAFTSQDGRITAIERQGALTTAATTFIAMNLDPALSGAATALTSGTVHMQRIDLVTAATISTIHQAAITAGSGLTAAQNFAGLYNAAGTRLAVTADQSVAWTTTGEKNMALVAPVAVPAGTYYVALLSNGTTPPQFLRMAVSASVADIVNHGLTTSTARWTTGPTAQTTLPVSITMASRVFSGTTYIAAVS